MSSTDILNRVSAARDISPAMIRGPRRWASIVRARHEVAWLLRQHTAMSYPEIGRLLDRDHSSVMHGVRCIAAAVALSEEYRAELDQIVRRQTFVAALAAALGVQGREPA